MDDEIDIEKIETFLQNLKNEKPISECIASNSAEDNRSPNDQSVSKTNRSQSKRYKSHILKSTATKEKQKRLQVSLKYNEECASILSSLEASLSILLEECLKEQKIIRENIDSIECNRGGDSKLARSGNIRKTCSSPYFKERDGFPCQFNEDFLLRKNAGYLDPRCVIKTLPWTDDQKRTLEKSIKDINIQNEKSAAHPTKNSTADSDRIDVKGVVRRQNKAVSFNEEKYDWIKISVVCLNSTRSPLECRAMWLNYLHPKVNKTRWTEKESQKLKMLVEENNYEDWESISRDLGTNRSAYQCIGHFKIRLADFSKIKWSERDVLFIQKLVKMFRVNNFTPWGKLSWLMDGRSSSGIYRKWRAQYGDIKKGTFSLEEDLLLVVALKQFGEDWSLISQYLPNRDNVQVRGRVMVLKGRAGRSGPWTQSEDMLLEQLVQKYGFGNWAKISTHFLTRTNVQLRGRYKTIMKRKGKTASDTPTPLTLKSRKDERSLDGLWKSAMKLVQDKLKIDPKDSKSQINMIYELSRILKPPKKRGRKKGKTNFPLLHEEFHNFFHVAHSQRGGRGKDICTEVPTLVYQTVLTLHLLYAKIVLPSQKKYIEEDCNLLDMDKSVLIFLIDRKESVLDNCKFITFEATSECRDFPDLSVPSEHSLKSICSNETQCEEWYPLCPPSGSILIGLRTMLLNRKNIREQSKGLTVQNINTNSSQTLSRTDKYQFASTLWNQRLGMMYTWAAIFSKMYPKEQFIIDPTPQNKDAPSKELEKKSQRKRRKGHYKKNSKKRSSVVDTDGQGEDSDLMLQAKQKRTYVKSGKFTAKAQIRGNTRRQTRNTKADSDNVCIN